MASYTYSPNDCFLNLGGLNVDFNKVTVKSARDSVGRKEGTRGEKVFNIARADPFQEFTIAIPQSSRANLLLNTLFEAQQAGGPMIPGSITNINGGAGCTVPQGRIVKKPGPDFGEEAGDTEWLFVGEGKINQTGALV